MAAARSVGPGESERPLLLVGRVARPHGLAGEVSVVLVGDDPDRLAARREIWFEKGADPPRLLRVATSRAHGTRLLVRFEGVEGRDGAELLAGGELSVRFDPADVEEGSYYPHQLEGLAVVTVGGRAVGRVAGVIFGPGRPFLEVRDVRGTTALVPFHEDIVKEVDLAAGRVTIDPPEGLLEL